ncbi:hypothetical protein BC826DRAFT_1043427 [Russula brevipes]|nr:hypothetical protein BC826DRAFT_1043427 [Russula brevipes]
MSASQQKTSSPNSYVRSARSLSYGTQGRAGTFREVEPDGKDRTETEQPKERSSDTAASSDAERFPLSMTTNFLHPQRSQMETPSEI